MLLIHSSHFLSFYFVLDSVCHCCACLTANSPCQPFMASRGGGKGGGGKRKWHPPRRGGGGGGKKARGGGGHGGANSTADTTKGLQCLFITCDNKKERAAAQEVCNWANDFAARMYPVDGDDPTSAATTTIEGKESKKPPQTIAKALDDELRTLRRQSRYVIMSSITMNLFIFIFILYLHGLLV
jgi:hypothetical protein